jgi:hypothetical protein
MTVTLGIACRRPPRMIEIILFDDIVPAGGTP